MARKKRKTATLPSDGPKNLQIQSSSLSQTRILSPKNIVLLVIFVLIVLVWKFKGSFIAATVNGYPISSFQLNGELRKRFGSQVLDNLINERLILGATRQKGIFVTGEEIDNRIKQIEGKLQGQTSLDEALKLQGLTKEDLKKQLEIQLAIDKMFDKEASVSSEEIDDYIAKNKEITKTATDVNKLKEDVKAMLKQQKLADAFDKWFGEIKKGAKVIKFL